MFISRPRIDSLLLVIGTWWIVDISSLPTMRKSSLWLYVYSNCSSFKISPFIEKWMTIHIKRTHRDVGILRICHIGSKHGHIKHFPFPLIHHQSHAQYNSHNTPLFCTCKIKKKNDSLMLDFHADKEGSLLHVEFVSCSRLSNTNITFEILFNYGKRKLERGNFQSWSWCKKYEKKKTKSNKESFSMRWIRNQFSLCPQHISM